MMFTLLLLAAIAGMVVTSSVATKLADRDVPGLVKSLLGVVGGLVGEGVRWVLVFFILKLFAEAPAAGSWTERLVVFRYANIPYLVGWGFMVGSAAGRTKAVNCPVCQKPLVVDKESAKAKLKPSDYEYIQSCAACGALVAFHPETFEILRHELPTKEVGAPPA
jgi:hypothetical protein